MHQLDAALLTARGIGVLAVVVPKAIPGWLWIPIIIVVLIWVAFKVTTRRK